MLPTGLLILRDRPGGDRSRRRQEGRLRWPSPWCFVRAAVINPRLNSWPGWWAATGGWREKSRAGGERGRPILLARCQFGSSWGQNENRKRTGGELGLRQGLQELENRHVMPEPAPCLGSPCQEGSAQPSLPHLPSPLSDPLEGRGSKAFPSRFFHVHLEELAVWLCRSLS